jgi:phospholipase/carboxylesterase
VLTGSESFLADEGGWTFRVKPALSKPPASLIILMHGWTGDENSMGIFSRGLESSVCLFPRAPIKLENGFAWVETQTIHSAQLQDFWPVAQALFEEISRWINTYQLNDLPVYLAGFSQGAAMALTLAIRYPLFQRTAILSGFLPEGGVDYLLNHALVGKEFLIAHGRLDDIVPVDLARETFQALDRAGAAVDYCEEEVGHKLSKHCFDRLKAFLTRRTLPLEK